MRKKDFPMQAVSLIVGLMVVYLWGATVHADQLVTTEFQVTTTPNPFFESLPSIEEDATGGYVVYTQFEQIPTGFGPANILMQRIDDSGIIGSPILIASDEVLDEELPDADGDFIVYTAFEEPTVGGLSGRIKLHQISTGETTILRELATLREARIHGNYVVWVEGPADSLAIQLLDISTLGTGLGPTTISGSHVASSPEIGSRFVVWEEFDASVDPQHIQHNIRAYDLVTGLDFDVAVDPNASERFPCTSGPWIVWQAHDLDQEGTPQNRKIEILNVDTGERRTIHNILQLEEFISFVPTIDKDIITWESNVTGNYEIYLYRISTRETFQVTNRSNDQRLNNVFGNQVVYLEISTDNWDVFTTTFSFVPDAQPDIEVAPPSLNFGNVELFSSQSAIVTIQNVVPDADLTVSDFALSSGGTGDFTLTTVPATPLVIPANGSADVEVTFTPSSEGAAADSLDITSDDPDESLVSVAISGTGIVTEVPPEEQIANILEFIDTAVSEGTLAGSGNGNSAENRLNALINMIEAAGDLIEQGQIVEACDQLASAYKKTDGLPKPPDFVEGESAAELATRIQDLRTDLGCE
ncbi:choice-of-anchor D domain-containing protein [Candidatus Nitronereus thalassa]|uniref:Choice-of-anchor D domain-containing protein n=1 Tax=Candidatus Nitronereus thalassa TaxID=3020898 RepID=A0ABU3K498_9BACT|nr:choice-of-anchor D domain-containing protein [Candidatus Nitronereus thalassa]MDT7041203.1 choice-of-anchor D domain-containing protein [Candidatus Nitronereus thalassa]